jgi:hypothetical protein
LTSTKITIFSQSSITILIEPTITISFATDFHRITYEIYVAKSIPNNARFKICINVLLCPVVFFIAWNSYTIDFKYDTKSTIISITPQTKNLNSISSISLP